MTPALLLLFSQGPPSDERNSRRDFDDPRRFQQRCNPGLTSFVLHSSRHHLSFIYLQYQATTSKLFVFIEQQPLS